MNTIFLNSNTVKKQSQDHNFGILKVELRYDDSCGNGHNTFSITGEYGFGRNKEMGCIHKRIRQSGEFQKYLKWHLCSSTGPLHYVANSLYWAKEGNLDYARKSAIWDDAELEDFTEEKLMARLPGLMEEFKRDMIELGFNY